MIATGDEVRARLDELTAGGAARLDPEGVRVALTLLERADVETEGAAARLRERAFARLDAIELSMAEAREKATVALEALREGGVSGAPAEASFSAGDYAAAAREARLALRRAERARTGLAAVWVQRLMKRSDVPPPPVPSIEPSLVPAPSIPIGREASPARTSSPPASSRSSVPPAPEPRPAPAVEVASHERFRRSAGSVRATLVVERAADDLPEGAGPYNAQVLAARTLKTVAELSSGYVTALVGCLDDLAALATALAPPPPAPKKKAPRKPRRKPGPPPA